MILATIICVLACALLVFAEWRQLARLRIASKLIASLAFLTVGVLAMTTSDGRNESVAAFTGWIIGGLAFGVGGDLALLGRGKRAFMLGLAAFLVGHLAYVIGMAQLISPTRWFATAELTVLVPIGVAAIALVKLWPHLGSMKVPVLFYVVTIVAMVIGAFAALRDLETGDAVRDTLMAMVSGLPADNRNLLAIGAVLFFASDLAVARDKFITRTFANKAWGLPVYYGGQLCIAWSLAL